MLTAVVHPFRCPVPHLGTQRVLWRVGWQHIGFVEKLSVEQLLEKGIGSGDIGLRIEAFEQAFHALRPSVLSDGQQQRSQQSEK